MKNLKLILTAALLSFFVSASVYSESTETSNSGSMTYEVMTNTTLNLRCLISGLFYNVFNTEEITVELWSFNSAYPVFSAPVIQLNPAIGQLAPVDLGNLSGNYYIVFKYDNSLPTWSKYPVSFSSGMTFYYNFTSSSGQAYSDNQILLNASPVLYGGCSGDVDQDGIIDGTDLMYIYNDYNLYVPNTGLPTDLNMNGIVSSADLVIADDNAIEYRIEERPW